MAHQRRAFLRIRAQVQFERPEDLLRSGGQVILGLSDPDQLDRLAAERIIQPHKDKIQAEHTLKHIEQGASDLRWITATPDGGKRKYADQITNAAPKALDLFG
jgi:hypothetical protein